MGSSNFNPNPPAIPTLPLRSVGATEALDPLPAKGRGKNIFAPLQFLSDVAMLSEVVKVVTALPTCLQHRRTPASL